MIFKKKKVSGLILFFIIFSLLLQPLSITTLNNSIEEINQEQPSLSAQIAGIEYDWLNNSGFNPPATEWYNITNTDISNPDVNASISGGINKLANFEVLGNVSVFSEISGTPKSADWTDTLNPDFPAPPDQHGLHDQIGCWFSHGFEEVAADQVASMHWERNITMPVNMSDYIITSASLNAVFNATVDEDIEVPNDQVDYSATYDYARFYVLISDIEKNNVYEAADNQTISLGAGNTPGNKHSLTDTNMSVDPDEALIFYLTSALNADNRNFTVTLGIRVWCEDNRGIEDDHFDNLTIRSCDLTFTYEKKINQGSSVAWNQDGDRISELSPENYTVLATKANLNFKYTIDKNWTTHTSSQNSEINIYLNGNPYPIPIKLSDVNVNDPKQNATLDLTNQIGLFDSVNLSIEVLMNDEFELDEVITISIDNVTLDISYTIDAPDPPSSGGGGGGGTTIIRGPDYTPVIIGLVAGIIALVTFFGAYQKHYKYPPMVRKIRKLRKKIKKGKSVKSLIVKSRENIINSDFQKQMKILEVGVVSSKQISKVDKISKESNDKKIKGGAK